MVIKKSIIVFGAFIAIAGQLLLGGSTYAINPADFNPGRIIDDEVFYNKDAMNVAEIQSFLDAHVPACDTWGTQPSGYGNLTRAQYAQQIMGWHGPPYTCLDNYHENPDTGATSFENGGGSFSGGISAAQIIYNAAQQYRISPKALMVLLRKEALNIYGDSWPLKSQYKYAMGYACPDSGPGYSAACTDSKSGFYKQMTLAAWQLRYYYDHMGTYNFAPGRWNTIQYDPDPSCGTKQVYIQNYATASLYIYTPYTPSDAALNAYPGSAEPCGAYGNRNFWFMWQEWFGSPYAGVHISSSLRITSKYGSNVFANAPTTVSFDVRNDSGSAIDIGGMAIAVRDSGGRNYDYALKSMIIPARSTVTYSDTQILGREDTYTFSLANLSGGTWRSDYPTMMTATEVRSKTVNIWNAPSLTQSVNVSDGPFQTGKLHTITYAVRNNSSSTRTIGSFALAARGPNGENMDPTPATPVTLAAGQTQILSYKFKPTVEGVYKFGVAVKLNDWVADYPLPTSTEILNTITATAAPRVVISSSLNMQRDDPRVGQNLPLSFKIKNNSEETVDLGKLGLWGRDPQNRNVDPGVVATVLSPGEERTMSFGFRASMVGAYKFGVLSTKDGIIWNSGPSLANSNIMSNVSVHAKDGIAVTSSVSLQDMSASAYVGQSISIVYKVKNYQDVSANLGKLGLWGRDPQNRNVDPGVVATVLSPGEERTMSFPMSLNMTGGYKFGILQTLDNGVSWRDGPVAENGSQKSINMNVNSGVVVSQGLQSSLNTANIHASEVAEITFKVKNLTNASINLGKLGLWGRDPQNRNVDPGVVATVLSPGEERTMSFGYKPQAEGTHSFGILATPDNGATWTNGPDLANGQSGKLSFNAKQVATLTSTITATPTSISKGQCQTLAYTVKNFDKVNTANLGKLGLWGRDPQNRNVDPGVVATVLSPGEERTMSFPICYSTSGNYNYGVLQTLDNGKTWTNGPQKESDGLQNTLRVTVD